MGYTKVYIEHYKSHMTDKKQITVRVNEKLLIRLQDKYPYLDNDSEIIRLAMIILDMESNNA